jgi:hypothetical protein
VYALLKTPAWNKTIVIQYIYAGYNSKGQYFNNYLLLFNKQFEAIDINEANVLSISYERASIHHIYQDDQAYNVSNQQFAQ